MWELTSLIIIVNSHHVQIHRSDSPLHHNLIRKPEPLRPLQHPLPLPLPLICSVKVQREDSNNPNNQNMTPNTNPNRRHIPWTLLLPHNKTPRNTSRAIKRRHRRSRKHPLPLTHDIVGLVGCHSRPVGDVCPCCEIRADVAHGNLVGEAEHAEADDERYAVECYDRPAELELVTDKG
jgi:hypothetical protein